MNRWRLWAASLTILMMIPLFCSPCGGTSYWNEEKNDFIFGDRTNTTFKDGIVELSQFQRPDPQWLALGEGGPTPRYAHAMAFDSANGVAVLFGGQQAAPSVALNDTWIYNFTMNTWTDISPPFSPPPRRNHQMVFDSNNCVMIMFGGQNVSIYNDTWTYDVRTNKWMERFPDRTPTARFSHSMVYDSRDSLTVLFGGDEDYIKGPNSETWIYNFSANTWAQMFPPLVPSNRGGAAMAYDSENDLVILFGGHWFSCYFNGETWAYDVDLNTWTLQTANPQTDPCARDWAEMVYDQSRRMVVLFGGFTGGLGNATVNYGDTWTYDAAAKRWAQVFGQTSPPPRCMFAMVYDSSDEFAFLWGGNGGQAFNDGWAYTDKEFSRSGTYTSSPHDLRGNAYFGRIQWDANISQHTAISFQLRSDNSSETVQEAPFIGPDGTTGSYYNESGETLYAGHNGSRYMQYRAYLSTTDAAETPLLKNVSISYNLMHDLTVGSPKLGQRWTGRHNISWTLNDVDNDSVRLDIFLEKDGNTTLLASNLTNGTTDWPFDTDVVPNGTYLIKFQTRDGNVDIPLTSEVRSEIFTIFHPPPPPENRPPMVSLVQPLNNTNLTSVNVVLIWNGVDPDGDHVNYSLIVSKEPFGPNDAPVPMANLSSTVFTLTNLSTGSDYYWAVLPNDGKTNGTLGGPWRFTVERGKTDGTPPGTGQNRLAWLIIFIIVIAVACIITLLIVRRFEGRTG